MARPEWHVLSAVGPVAVALWRGQPALALAVVSGTVLIDADHLVDWLLNHGREDYTRRIVVPLHGWEYPAALLAAGSAPRVPGSVRRLLLALGGSWLCHLVLDLLVNRPNGPVGYLLANRLRHRFARVPSGWLSAQDWQERHLTTHRPAPVETLLGSSLAALAVLVATRHSHA